MRIDDLFDYFKLRTITKNPYEIIRFRKCRDPQAELKVCFRERPPLFLRGDHADFHTFHRIFLRDEYRLEGLITKPQVVLDLGGNVGLFAVRIAAECTRLIICEPIPDNIERLKKNTAGHENVALIEKAVTSSVGTLNLYLPKSVKASDAFSSFGDNDLLTEECLEVKTTSLEQIFKEQQLEKVDLLKIDIEGSEYEVLHSSTELLARIQSIHGEYHDVNPEDPRTRIDHFTKFLDDNGYSVLVEPHLKHPNKGMFFATRN